MISQFPFIGQLIIDPEHAPCAVQEILQLPFFGQLMIDDEHCLSSLHVRLYALLSFVVLIIDGDWIRSHWDPPSGHINVDVDNELYDQSTTEYWQAYGAVHSILHIDVNGQ